MTDVQREMAEVLFEAQRADNGSGSVGRAEMLAAAILPVVQRAEKRAAAAALRDAADAVRHQLPGYIGRIDTADSLDDRAAALDPT